MHLTPYEPQAIDGFVANVPNKTKLSLGIKQSFAFVAAMVKARPCLKIDFQVYLRNDGTVLNIDLDRCDDGIVAQKRCAETKICPPSLRRKTMGPCSTSIWIAATIPSAKKKG